MSAPRTVALLGGSFDPPHIGHVLMASWALCQETVDEVWLLPTYAHPFGKNLSDFQVRCERCELAIDHLGPGARVERIEAESQSPWMKRLTRHGPGSSKLGGGQGGDELVLGVEGQGQITNPSWGRRTTSLG